MNELVVLLILVGLGALAALGCGLLVYGMVTVIRALTKG